jgi:hypothetical protein
MYKRDALEGGHVIMLGKGNDEAVSTIICKYMHIHMYIQV